MTQDKFAADDTGIQSGGACTESNLYKCSYGNFEVLQFVEAGQPFPNTPFGTDSSARTAWRKVTVATDGDRKTFDGRGVTASIEVSE